MNKLRKQINSFFDFVYIYNIKNKIWDIQD